MIEGLRKALGTDKKFYPGLEQVKKHEIMGVPLLLLDATIVEDWDGEYGTSDFAILRVKMPDGKEVTVSCGGKAVVRQIRLLKKRTRLPGCVSCFINKVENAHGQEYYVLDDDEKKAEAVGSAKELLEKAGIPAKVESVS